MSCAEKNEYRHHWEAGHLGHRGLLDVVDAERDRAGGPGGHARHRGEAEYLLYGEKFWL